MTTASVLASIDAYVTGEIAKVEGGVASWWKGFSPILASDFEKFASVAAPIALSLVEALAENLIMPGPVKLSVVSAGLIAAAKAQGIAATQTMADTVVQQVVASIAASIPNATPPSAQTSPGK